VLGVLSHERMNVLEERCEMDGREICDCLEDGVGRLGDWMKCCLLTHDEME
jgi:hypothetical protein